jgi:hypothetical protein
MLKREKFIPPSRDEMFIWEFFTPAKAGWSVYMGIFHLV